MLKLLEKSIPAFTPTFFILGNLPAQTPPRERLNCDANRLFSKGGPTGVEQTEFDASGWRSLELPHDRSIGSHFEFDGIRMNGEIWVNGHHLGMLSYGYMGVRYHPTPHLKPGGPTSSPCGSMVPSSLLGADNSKDKNHKNGRSPKLWSRPKKRSPSRMNAF